MTVTHQTWADRIEEYILSKHRESGGKAFRKKNWIPSRVSTKSYDKVSVFCSFLSYITSYCLWEQTCVTMTRFKAVVEYDGTQYHGWQWQKDVPTVQGAMEKALQRILPDSSRIVGAGRTDAGVHAEGQVIHFDAHWTRSTTELLRGWNALLPPDIVVRSLSVTSEAFHARHSARSKTYRYVIRNHLLRCPLSRFYAWHLSFPLDITLMKEATSHLMGTHNFAAFGQPTDGTPSTVREVLHADWCVDEPGEFLSFMIVATGYLRYMVRSLVGTLVLVGRGKLTPDEFAAILGSGERNRSGPTAPPHGLRLISIEYSPETHPAEPP